MKWQRKKWEQCTTVPPLCTAVLQWQKGHTISPATTHGHAWARAMVHGRLAAGHGRASLFSAVYCSSFFFWGVLFDGELKGSQLGFLSLPLPNPIRGE